MNKPPLQRRSKALTQMRTWISCHRSLLASWVLYAGSINMTNAVDSLNVENNVEESRCATALASHAGIPEPLVLRFEECGGSLPPGGSLWREEYQGWSCLDQIHGASRLPPRPCGDHPQESWVLRRARGWLLGSLVSAPPDSYRGVMLPRLWIFALAFGAVSKYTSTLTLVEGENRCEGL